MDLASDAVKQVRTSEGPAYWISDTLITCKALSEFTGGRYSLFEVWDAPGSGPLMHAHYREDEAYYILEGEYEIRYQDAPSLRVGPGDYVYVPKGTFHEYRSLGKERGRQLVLTSPGGMEHFFAELGQLAMDRINPPPPPVDPPDLDRILAIGRKYEIEMIPPSS